MNASKLIAALLLASCFSAAAETTPIPTEKPDEAAILKLVKQLDSEDFCYGLTMDRLSLSTL